MIQKDLLGSDAKNDGICDNTDCEHKNHEFVDVWMSAEFDGDKVCWCRDCIERDKEMLAICEWCDNPKRETYFRAVYHPFDENPSFEGYICNYCDDDIYWCDECGREIFESNGMRKNIRFDTKTGEMVCVSCLQKKWFVKGMERFEEGDWFSDKDLLEHGFVDHQYYFCRKQIDYDEAKKEFNLLKEQGWLVILSIERSGMGLEHHIRIWKKLPKFGVFITNIKKENLK